MAKRRLTDQQKNRIVQSQKEIVDAYEEHGEDSGYHKAQVVAQTRRTAVLLKEDGEHLKASIRQGIKDTACGDYVLWETSIASSPVQDAKQGTEQEVALVAVLPRYSVLQRPKGKYGDTRPFAANIDCIVIVMAHKPSPRPDLLDRYLVFAESANIRPIIVFNKIDLLTDDDSLPEYLELYRSMGYKVFTTSVKSGAGIDELETFLGQYRSVFTGQSGVGKSTLIQHAIPDQEIQIGRLSDNMKGRHTTSTSMLYTLHSGGQFIDTPGVRDIAVWHLDSDTVDRGFIEFAPYFGQCKFSDCTHTHEPDCALQLAVQNGDIDQRRFNNYLTIQEQTPPD